MPFCENCGNELPETHDRSEPCPECGYKQSMRKKPSKYNAMFEGYADLEDPDVRMY